MASKREKERALKDFIQGSFSKKMASKGFGVTAKGELGDTVSDLVADYLADMLLQIEGYLESVDEVVEEAFQAEKQKRVSGAKTKAEKTAANRFNKSSFNKMLGSKAVQAASPELASVLSNASQLKQIQAAIYSGTASPDDYKKLTGLFRKGIGGLGALASKGTTGNAIADTATDAARRRNLERKFTEEQIDRQTKELTKGLNSSLEDYIDKNYNEFNKRFAKESSNSLKLGLMAFLGPASPLVELLDETFDLEEKIEKKTRKFQEKFLQMQNNVANATIQTNESVKGVDSAIAASARAELEYQQEQTKTEKSFMLKMFGRLYRSNKDIKDEIKDGLNDVEDAVSKGRGIFGGLSVSLGAIGSALKGLVRFLGPVAAVASAFLLGKKIGDSIYNAVGDQDWFMNLTDKVFDTAKKVTAPATAKKSMEKTGLVYTPTNQNISAVLDRASKEFGIDRGEIYAAAHTESGFNENAVSSTGATGLFQFTRDTWDRLIKMYPEEAAKYGINPLSSGIDDRKDPWKNAVMYSLLKRADKKALGKVSTGDSALDSYLTHALGVSEARKFIQASQSPGGMHLRSDAILNSRSVSGHKAFFQNRTIGESMDIIRARSSDKAAAYNEYFASSGMATPNPGAANVKYDSGASIMASVAASSGGAGTASQGGIVNVDTVPMYVDDSGVVVMAVGANI